MDFRKTAAIFQKQIKDIGKNKAVLIQFILFPVMTIIMENAVRIDGMPEHFFVTIFASMYLAMAPIISMASILSEEKEKNTLRVLMLSNVRPMEYLLGVGGCVWFICMLGSVVFAVLGGYRGAGVVCFFLLMALGIIISILIGSVIGIWCKNEMAANSVTVPVMVIFSFLPMLSTFNDTIKQVGNFAYSQQIQNLINGIGSPGVDGKSILVVGLNLAAALGLFIFAYRKRGLS